MYIVELWFYIEVFLMYTIEFIYGISIMFIYILQCFLYMLLFLFLFKKFHQEIYVDVIKSFFI